MILKALLLLGLVASLLFAWRARSMFPALAVMAAVVAGGAALLLARAPVLLLLGLAVAGGIILQVSRPRR